MATKNVAYYLEWLDALDTYWQQIDQGYQLKHKDTEPLQDIIDAAAEAQELEDDMADREFWAAGQW